MTTLQDLMSYARIQMIDKPECCGSISDCVEDAIDNINNNDNEEELSISGFEKLIKALTAIINK